MIGPSAPLTTWSSGAQAPSASPQIAASNTDRRAQPGEAGGTSLSISGAQATNTPSLVEAKPAPTPPSSVSQQAVITRSVFTEDAELVARFTTERADAEEVDPNRVQVGEPSGTQTGTQISRGPGSADSPPDTRQPAEGGPAAASSPAQTAAMAQAEQGYRNAATTNAAQESRLLGMTA